MILLSCSFLLWSVFFFPLFPPDAMPEHSELIDGDPGLGVYWESKNSFIRNDARLYWRAGAVRVSCPVQLGGRASGMKPTSFKKSSKNGTGRSIGQAVACLVMAAAITIGGAGTTFLLASQPAGLTVEPAALQTEGRVTLPKFDHKSDRSEAKAESTQPEGFFSGAGRSQHPCRTRDQSGEHRRPGRERRPRCGARCAAGGCPLRPHGRGCFGDRERKLLPPLPDRD